MALNLSRKETMENHRKMWNWIAYETLKRKDFENLLKTLITISILSVIASRLKNCN